MKQGSTYPIIITVPGIDLSGADWIIVSLKPRMKPVIEFNKADMRVSADEDGTELVISLTQEQSLALNEGNVTVDLNWMMDGTRGGCIPRQITLMSTLLKRVVNV